MYGRYVWRVLIVGALLALAVISPAEAATMFTHGPDFSASFSPSGGAQVGQDVNIHVRVNSANPGATRISVGCGNVSKAETSEVEFDSTWRTGDCGAGNTSVNICTKAPDDPNWQDPNCNNFGYSLSANNPPPQPTSPPSVSCSVNSFNVSPNPATAGGSIHITGSGSCNTGVRATKVKIDGGDFYEIGAPSLDTSWNGASAGTHHLKFMVAGRGDNDWSSAASQTISLTVNDQNNPPPPSSTNCNITSVDLYPSSPQAPGVNVKINAAGKCDSGVRAWRVKIDGGIQYEFGASPTFTWTWNTSGWSDGNHRVRIELASNGDNDWSNIDADAVTYTLASNAPPPANPNDAFTTGDVIKIGYDVFVIIKEGSAIQRRLVPNPQTLDALGISQGMINNKGFGNDALSIIGRGVDIPDVSLDPQGFATFKATFLPNLVPIVPGQQQSGQSQSSSVGTDGACPGFRSRQTVGNLAKINGEGDQLKLRQSPDTSAGVITEMPTGYQFQIVGGPKCNDGYTWWQISTPDGTGWSAEGKDKYWMSKPLGSAPVPTQPPAQQPQPQSQSSDTKSGTAPNGQTAQADPNLPKPTSTADQIVDIITKLFGGTDVQGADRCEPQCMVEAQKYRPDICSWVSCNSMTDPMEVLSAARSSSKVHVRGANEYPAKNDLVIWTSDVLNNGTGHIGVVTYADQNIVIIHDANWKLDCSKRDITLATAKARSYLMFISSPGQGQPQPAQSGTKKCTHPTGWMIPWCSLPWNWNK